ncbi:MAG: ABC transporter ATP-binding protein [Candidatus Schekmanbacteria bacterium]|nr:ABC transporter ATP-binding protein [Candidatus Schekmanbacteria bacterium]
MSALLEVDGVSFSYGTATTLRNISFAVGSNDLLALIGPNGSGKSTLLRIAAGLMRPDSGVVRLAGASLASLSRRAIARRIAFVPQETTVAFPFGVGEIVMMGRYPHLSAFGFEGERDAQVAREAMAATETLHLADRSFAELSGGEKQRVLIAAALAQEPEILVLDEPTSSLDLHHQVGIFRTLLRANERGLTIIAALHDLNLAAGYCSRLMLLDSGAIAAIGAPRDVLTETRLAAVYRTAVRLLGLPDGAFFVVPKYQRGSAT